ncbi:MAG TPA: EamA family transporter [Casimicrobiaceae bacterium]|nr:EamA family transporter [Casimicrobiaceae bacterium]
MRDIQPRWIVLTLVCVAMLVVGQLLFKRAATQWKVDGVSWTTVVTFFSPTLIAAVLLYGMTTVLWVLVLKHVPLVLALPFNSLVFIAAPVAAYWLFDEPVTWRTLVGGAMIVAGVIVAVR